MFQAILLLTFLGAATLFSALLVPVMAVSDVVLVVQGQDWVETTFLCFLTVGVAFLGFWIVRMAVDAVRRDLVVGARWRDRVRLQRFASANTMRYSVGLDNPPEVGAIFGYGDRRREYDSLTRASGFKIGNYQSSGVLMNDRSLRRWGVVRIPLARPLPHVVLEARANRRGRYRSNFPVPFAFDQRLSLEGDFDRYFTLRTPGNYERDALYIFTPDLMALLIDNASSFDVEIVDRWMYLYSARPFRMTDQSLWERVFAIVDVVGTKVASSSQRYADERAPEARGTAVAAQGRRLRVNLPLWAYGVIFGGTFYMLQVILRLLLHR
jgi:hypothetical protein